MLEANLNVLHYLSLCPKRSIDKYNLDGFETILATNVLIDYAVIYLKQRKYKIIDLRV